MGSGRPNDPRAAYLELRGAMNFVEYIARLFAKTVQVFFRHDFGARYFNISDILGSTFTLLLALFGIGILVAYNEPKGAERNADPEMYPLLAFIFGFLAIGAVHCILAWHYKKQRPFWHSRYSGTSHIESLLPDTFRDYLNREIMPFLGISLRYVIQRFVEPLLTIIAGGLIGTVLNAPLGMWLIIGGLAVAAIEWINAARYKNRIADAMDAQIEAQWLGEAITTTMPEPSATNGFVLPVPSYFKPEERKALYSGMVQLDPALKAIMDEPILEPATPPQQPAAIVEKESWEI